MNYLFFDTETSGLPKKWQAAPDDFDNWPRLVSLAYFLTEEREKIISAGTFIIYPEEPIPDQAAEVHGIDTKTAEQYGIPLEMALAIFDMARIQADVLVGHNVKFDRKILQVEFLRTSQPDQAEKMRELPMMDTMHGSTDFCRLPKNTGHRGYKWPKLEELYLILFKNKMQGAHNALNDINATRRCFWELIDKGIMALPEIKTAVQQKGKE